MTALIGAAVLGLVPLPPMAISDSRGSHSEHYWPSEAAELAYRVSPSQGGVERLATREEPERLRQELGSSGAETTGNGLRPAGEKWARAECSC